MSYIVYTVVPVLLYAIGVRSVLILKVYTCFRTAIEKSSSVACSAHNGLNSHILKVILKWLIAATCTYLYSINIKIHFKIVNERQSISFITLGQARHCTEGYQATSVSYIDLRMHASIN
jgi:hypothetical protein